MRTFKEWRAGCLSKKYRHLIKESSDYEDGDILRFWYIVDQDSPAVSKFVIGLSNLMADCFPEERQYTETLESDNSSLLHRYICICHEDDK